MKRTLAAALLLCVSAAQAQETPSTLRIAPQDDATFGFVIDRRTTVRRGPGYTYDTPRTRRVVSTIRVRPRPGEQPDRLVLEVTFVRVHGFQSGDEQTEDITFDRKAEDPPSGRPETLIVGRTVELETRRDGALLAVRGVDEAIGSAVAATAAIEDLRALVTSLPPADAKGAEWTTETLEGRALLRTRVTALHEIRHLTDSESRITITGKITAAPEGAGESFGRSFRVERGERSGRYRVSRLDGLPLEGRLTTLYAVEARLSGSDMQVGVDTETIVSVRRTGSPDDPGSEAALEPPAPVPGDETPNSGLPGWLGTPRDVIRKLAGAPTRTGGGVVGGTFDTFGALGLVYEYDDDGFVRRVTATKATGQEPFGGRVLGVALGDELARCVELWGATTSRRTTSSEYDQVRFVFDALMIELEVWRADGEDEAFGAYRADTVKRIRVTDRKGR